MTADSGATEAEAGSPEVQSSRHKGWQALMLEGSSRWPHREGAKCLHRARLTAQDCISPSEVILQECQREWKGHTQTVTKMTVILLLFFIQQPFSLKGINISAVRDNISSLPHTRWIFSVQGDRWKLFSPGVSYQRDTIFFTQ